MSVQLPVGVELYQIIPTVVAVFIIVAFGYYVVGYGVSRREPATNEPVIGNYTIYLMGQSRQIQGITTTAYNEIDDDIILNIAKVDKTLETLGRSLKKLHLYGIREGNERVLIISGVTIETKEYSDSSQGRKFQYPYGFLQYRNVFADGREISKKTFPDLFGVFKPGWDKAVIIYPRNNENLTTDYERMEGDTQLLEAVSMMKNVALAAKYMSSKDEVIKVLEGSIDDLGQQLANVTDEKQFYFEMNQANRPLDPLGGRHPYNEKPTINLFTLPRLGFMAAGAYLGGYNLPIRTELTPGNAAIIGAVLAFVAMMVYDKFWGDAR